MSYCRWSTVINPNLSWHEELFLIKNGVPWEKIQKINSKGKEISDWYIFYHADSGETKEEQYLAVWSKYSDKYPTLDYGTVRYMVDTGDFSLLEADPLTQIEFMKERLGWWLEDIEEEFKE